MKNAHLFLEDKYVFTRLQAIIWAKSGLLVQNSLQQSAVDCLIDIYENISTEKTLVISCKRINEVSGNKSLDSFFKVCQQKNRKVVFIDFENDLVKDAIENIAKRIDNLERKVTKHEICFCDNTIIPNDISIVKSIEQGFVKSAVKDCYKQFQDGNNELVSTSIMASGEFDATKIISNPKQFLWTSMLLADEFENLIKEIQSENKSKKGFNKYKEIKLISVSLRACPFVSSVGLLTNTTYDTIDHLGPKHKLFDIEVLENIKKNVRYVFVGDFVAGGTEIKIAQTYITLLGCNLMYAIAIGSLLKKESFDKHFILRPIVYLKQLEIENLNYQLPIQE